MWRALLTHWKNCCRQPKMGGIWTAGTIAHSKNSVLQIELYSDGSYTAVCAVGILLCCIEWILYKNLGLRSGHNLSHLKFSFICTQPAEKPQADHITRDSDTSARDEAGEIGFLYGQMCNKPSEVLTESWVARQGSTDELYCTKQLLVLIVFGCKCSFWGNIFRPKTEKSRTPWRGFDFWKRFWIFSSRFCDPPVIPCSDWHRHF